MSCEVLRMKTCASSQQSGKKTKMPRSVCYTATLLFAIIFCLETVVAEDCNPGIHSPGWISPSGDVFVEEGKPVEMFCYLNTSHPDAIGGTYRNLSFEIDAQPAAYPWVVEPFNETAIRLTWNETKVSPDGNYVVACRQNEVKGICTRYVYVGYPPLNVTDFQCTSYNWQRLECLWIEPYNPISTSYALSYQMLQGSRIRPMTRSCPGNLSPKRTFVTSKATADEPGVGQCNWVTGGDPPYIPSSKAFNFTMSMINDLTEAPILQALGVVDNYAIVVPNPMENLRAVEVSRYSARIAWNVPDNLIIFPPGLVFRVAYNILANWTDTAQFHEVEAASEIVWSDRNGTYQLELTLPYANAKYNVSVWARSFSANVSDPRFWSIPAWRVIQTEADKPCKAPEAVLGSFQVSSTWLEQRSVTLRWSQLAEQCENGPRPGYHIVMLDAQDNFLDSKNVTSVGETQVNFDNLNREQAYKFLIYSYNGVGYSHNASEVFLPAASNMPTAPEEVMRIAYNDRLFEIQWTASSPSRGLSMATFGHEGRLLYPPVLTGYTVFWCRSVRDTPVTCLGELKTQQVDPSVTSLNVTVPDGSANYQFAVAAQQGPYYGSGMTWSTCIVVANGNGSQIKQVEVVSASSYSLDVAWTLPCSVQGGIITGFNIYYCAVSTGRGDSVAYDNEEPSCFSPPAKAQAGPTDSRYTIGQLEPFTVYKIVMSVETRLGEGQSSTPLINRTAEGIPSIPLDLAATHVTNESLSFAWRIPAKPNGVSPTYLVYRNGVLVKEFAVTKVVLEADSYTDYSLSVRACNGPSLCSDFADPINIRTLIGVPGQPRSLRLKTKSENTSYIQINWEAPSKPAGPIHYSLLNFATGVEDDEQTFRIDGNATEQLVEMEEVCKPGSELKVRVMSVNQAEDGQVLMGPWSDEGTYQCRSEGLSMALILIISFSTAALVLVILLLGFFGRRVQMQKKAAKNVPIKMPWEAAGSHGSTVSSQPSKPTSMKDSSIAKTGVGNYYGQLKPKLPALETGSPSPVTDMKKQQSSYPQDSKTDDVTSDGHSHSSGLSTGQDSLSWRHPSSELSNDSGAELDPSSPGPDVFADGNTNPFSKVPPTGSHDALNMAIMTGDGYLIMDKSEGSSLPSNTTTHPQPYVQVGLAPPTTVASVTLAPSPSAGYVTIGPSQMADSPNASPNLSVGSNDSLIAKSERPAPIVRIVPAKRNSGYVEACLAQPEAFTSEPLAQPSTTPGYVTFKSQEYPNESRNGTASPSPTSPPSSTAATGGYVTLGTSSSAAPVPNTSTSAHYVQMGSSHHTLSYV